MAFLIAVMSFANFVFYPLVIGTIIAFIIEQILRQAGNAYDPVANESMRKIFEKVNYFNSWEEACKDVDAVAILTEWNEFRSMSIKRLKQLMSKPILLDTRNIIDVKKLKEYEFNFDNVGRGINNVN